MLIDVTFHDPISKKQYNLSVSNNQYIWSASKLLKKTLKYRNSEFKLFFRGERLNKHNKLSDYNIENGSIIIILLMKISDTPSTSTSRGNRSRNRYTPMSSFRSTYSTVSLRPPRYSTRPQTFTSSITAPFSTSSDASTSSRTYNSPQRQRILPPPPIPSRLQNAEQIFTNSNDVLENPPGLASDVFISASTMLERAIESESREIDNDNNNEPVENDNELTNQNASPVESEVPEEVTEVIEEHNDDHEERRNVDEEMNLDEEMNEENIETEEEIEGEIEEEDELANEEEDEEMIANENSGQTSGRDIGRVFFRHLYESQLEQLAAMGYQNEDAVLDVLILNGGDINTTLDWFS